jgi:surface antigen
MFRKNLIAAFGALALLIPAQAMALQCVPYARQASGVQIFGNANTWWGQAAGKYDRGTEPKVGAVMTFQATRGNPLGHVAMVSKMVSDREVLVDHANWSLIGGRRGHIERGARVIDVSAAGDWSAVRVWYATIGDMGRTTYPLHGFIYNNKPANDKKTETAIALR